MLSIESQVVVGPHQNFVAGLAVFFHATTFSIWCNKRRRQAHWNSFKGMCLKEMLVDYYFVTFSIMNNIWCYFYSPLFNPAFLLSCIAKPLSASACMDSTSAIKANFCFAVLHIWKTDKLMSTT